MDYCYSTPTKIEIKVQLVSPQVGTRPKSHEEAAPGRLPKGAALSRGSALVYTDHGSLHAQLQETTARGLPKEMPGRLGSGDRSSA